MTEIERKYRLVTPTPDNLEGDITEIAQGYLYTSPGELRLRRIGGKHLLTVKGDGALCREEWEQEIPAWVYELLWVQTEGRRIEKTRQTIPFGAYTLELDVYKGTLDGLIVMECEFTDEAQAAAFELPSWARDAVEVTEDKRFKNKALAVNGLDL